MSAGSPSPARLADGAASLLEHRVARLALSALIIVSLIPFRGFERYRWVFFTVFSVEFLARLLALRASPTRLAGTGDDHAAPPLPDRRQRVITGGLLLIDFVALLSFVPWSPALQQARWIRLFRLARMVLLFGYWTPVVNDLRTVVSRQERARQLGLLALVVVFLSFAGTVVLTTLAPGTSEVVAGQHPEGATGFGRHMWWAFRTIEDPGNLLEAPEGLTTALVSLLLTVCGLFVVSFLIGLGTDIVREIMHVSQTRPPGMHGHTVVVGLSPATERLLRELMAHYHKSRLRPLFAVVGDHHDRPGFLEAPELARVVYRHAERGDPGLLDRVDIARARRLVMLADASEHEADAQTIGRVLAAREASAETLIVAEVLDHANTTAVRVAGGAHTIVMPSEKLLGFYLAAVAREPGINVLLRELLTSDGQEIYSYVYGARRLGSPELGRPLPGFIDLFRGALTHEPDATLVPVAYITAADGDSGESNPRLVVNPAPGHAPSNACGFMALAPSFNEIRRFAQDLRPREAPDLEAAALVVPRLHRPGRPGDVRQVLLCGFRPATLSLVESLMLAWPGAHLRLLVASPARRLQVEEALAEHDTHVRLGLLQDSGPRGQFVPGPTGDLTYAPEGSTEHLGRLSIAVGDWTADRVLVALPDDGAHVGDMDIVYVLGGSDSASDGRIAMAVLKLAELQARDRAAFRQGFSVIASVADPHLRRHLQTRYRAWLGVERPLQVYSSQELRALFNFQSAAVPGFDALYSELLGPHGQSLMRLVFDPSIGPADGRVITFADLAGALVRERRLLVAVELADVAGVHVAPAPGRPGHRFGLRDLTALWVIDRDRWARAGHDVDPTGGAEDSRGEAAPVG